MDKNQFGKFGESTALGFLLKKGYKLLEKNYTCKFGEIDLIVSRGANITFVEVKTRKNYCFGRPCESINRSKKNAYKKCSNVLYK